MADGDTPSDWEALHKGQPPHRETIRGVDAVYEDDRQFPGCIVMRGGGRKIAIIPKDNLLSLRLATDTPPPATPQATRPTPLDLPRGTRKDKP